ncbi:MAG TPA: carboxypeptidase-like regulatory domain-containing protein [Candidatus Solibacter sp.]
MIVLIILLSAAYCAAAQPAAGIFGRVANGETHEAVRRAAIKVYDAKEQWDMLTDGEGRFTFPDLAPGDYTLIAHRDGYTDRAYKVERSDFAERKELLVELHAQAVITGRAVDGLGQALQSVQIQALGTGSNMVIASTESNDLGVYRLSGLDPGTYRLRAQYREGRTSEFDPTPLMLARAETPTDIVVKAGSLTTGIDFVLTVSQPVTVRGTLRMKKGGRSGAGREGKFEIGELALGANVTFPGMMTFDSVEAKRITLDGQPK